MRSAIELGFATATRSLSTLGKVSAGTRAPARSVRALTFGASLLFVISAGLLGRLPLLLSPIVLALALGYSYTKRFTALCHVVLGLAVALAPGGAWIAMGAEVTLAPW